MRHCLRFARGLGRHRCDRVRLGKLARLGVTVGSGQGLPVHVIALPRDVGMRVIAKRTRKGAAVRLAERMAEELQERDRQVAPSGEVRWHTTARKERKTMIDEGLMEGARPGVWALTPRGASLA